MIYGAPQVQAVRDVTDLIGIRTLVLRQYWQPTGAVSGVAAVDAFKPSVPSVPGGVLLMGEQTMRERGRYATYWTFQGVNGDGRSVTFKQRGQSLDYGFEPGFAQVPIHVHADFDAMRERFGGYPSNDGTTVIWPPTLDGGGGGGSGLSLVKQRSSNTNPLYGVQAYFEMEGVYHYRYAERQLPRGIFSGVGFIADGLPGEEPELKDGRDWLKAPTAFQRKGVVFDITEFYWLSRRGGWPKPIYRKGYF